MLLSTADYHARFRPDRRLPRPFFGNLFLH